MGKKCLPDCFFFLPLPFSFCSLQNHFRAIAVPYHTSVVTFLGILSLYNQPGKEQVAEEIICLTVNLGEVRVYDK